MKTCIFILLVALATSFHVRSEQHDYWYTANIKAAQTGVPFADVTWNYCDMKCVTFEKRFPGYDFFVINFHDAVYKPTLSACYALAPGSSTPVLWNKVAQNAWYEANCGSDTTDYQTVKDYTIVDQTGGGIGTKISY